MFKSGIKINWSHATEYLPIDAGRPGEAEIKFTIEYWKKNRRTFKYNTESSVSRKSSGAHKITIYYNHPLNKHIGSSDAAYWGYSEIEIFPGDTSGFAYWHNKNEPRYSGEGNWQALDSGIVSEKKRALVAKLQREQSAFRSALLMIESKCVISGESSPGALQAAHIYPACKGGREIIENGILLRADLHCLLDNGVFKINPSGYIVYVKFDQISSEYRNLIKEGVRLPSETVGRIAEALELAWNNRDDGCY